MVSISLINGSVTTNNGRKNMFNNNSSAFIKQSSTTPTTAQIDTLNIVRHNYSILLAEKKYEQIPSNYLVYLKLLTSLKSITVYDSKLSLLVQIAQNALVGAMNVNTIYTSYAYNEIKIALLNKRIEDILSNKNVVGTFSATSSTMVATKTMKLSPFFSYYIYLYGCPAYGVGFDPAKLAFIQKLPFFKSNGEFI